MIEAKCNKCGTTVIVDNLDMLKNITCTQPFYGRTSGICGGMFLEANNNNKNNNNERK